MIKTTHPCLGAQVIPAGVAVAELAQQRLKPAYNIALSDWFQAPVIHEVSRQAGRIRVNAADNVQVAKVLITILDEQGQTPEQYDAA